MQCVLRGELAMMYSLVPAFLRDDSLICVDELHLKRRENAAIVCIVVVVFIIISISPSS